MVLFLGSCLELSNWECQKYLICLPFSKDCNVEMSKHLPNSCFFQNLIKRREGEREGGREGVRGGRDGGRDGGKEEGRE